MNSMKMAFIAELLICLQLVHSLWAPHHSSKCISPTDSKRKNWRSSYGTVCKSIRASACASEAIQQPLQPSNGNCPCYSEAINEWAAMVLAPKWKRVMKAAMSGHQKSAHWGAARCWTCFLMRDDAFVVWLPWSLALMAVRFMSHPGWLWLMLWLFNKDE